MSDIILGFGVWVGTLLAGFLLGGAIATNVAMQGFCEKSGQEYVSVKGERFCYQPATKALTPIY